MKRLLIFIAVLLVSAICIGCSIYVNQKGDTVTEYRYKYVYRYKDRIDTLYISSRDTVSVPYPVEKELTAWQQTKINYGGWAIVLVFVFILIVFGRFIYKLKR